MKLKGFGTWSSTGLDMPIVMCILLYNVVLYTLGMGGLLLV